MILTRSTAEKLQQENLTNQSVYALEVCCDGDDATGRMGKLLTAFGDRTGQTILSSSNAFTAQRDHVALFADDADRSYACCIIKPDATVAKTVTVNEGTSIVEKEVRPWEEIKSAIESEDLIIVGQLEVTLTKEDMIALYPEDVETEVFKEQLIPHMTSGKSIIVAVEGTSAVKRLQVLMGPSNAEKARSIAPSTLRARFGKDDDVENAVSGSISDASAKREIERFFPRGFEIQQTLAMIKPDAVRAGYAHSILARIRAEGFTVIQQQKVRLTKSRAQAFYAEHQGRFFYENLVSKMSSDYVYAMVLAKPGAIKHWRQLLGPTNVSRAVAEKPNSIRALFGKDGTSNAAHGSDSTSSADREISFFFPRVPRRHFVDATKAQKYLASKEKIPGLKRSLNATVIEGCVELCKAKPQGLDAIRWLGRWFLEQSRGHESAAEKKEKKSTTSPSSSSSTTSNITSGAMTNAKIYDDVSQSDVVFVLGEPGSGAHIVCDHLSKSFGYELLKISNLCSDSNEGSRVNALRDAMEKSPRRKFVVEGFPKTLSEAFAFEKSICECKLLIHVDVSEATISNRLQDFGVVDDKQMQRRLTKIRDQSHQLVNFYNKLGRAIRIDGDSDLDVAWAQVSVNFQKQVHFVLESSSCLCKKIQDRVVKDFEFDDIRLKDLIQREIALGSQTGRYLKDLLKTEQLVPNETKMQLLKDALDRSMSDRVLVRDFPSSLEEAQAFEKYIGTCSRVLRVGQSDEEVSKFYQTCGLLDTIDSNQSEERILNQARDRLVPRVIFVVGAPGSNSSDVCVRVANDYDIKHLSVGSLLRAEIARGSEIGRELDKIVRADEAVPASKTVSLLERYVARDGRVTVVSDFLSNMEHVQALSKSKTINVSKVVYFKANAATLRERDNEDDEEAFDRRLDDFVSLGVPVIEHYARAGKLDVVNIDQCVDQDALREDLKRAVAPQIVHGCKDDSVETTLGYKRVSFQNILSAAKCRQNTALGKLLVSSKEKSLAMHALRLATRGFGDRFVMSERLSDDDASEISKTVASVSACSTEDDLEKLGRLDITLLFDAENSNHDDITAYLCEEQGCLHIDIDKIIESEIRAGTSLGSRVSAYVNLNRNLPCNIVNELIRRESRNSGKTKILLEGYPRLRSRTYPLVHDQAFALGQEVSKVLVLNSSSSKRDKIYESEMLPAVDFYESRTDVSVSKISGDENSSVVDQLSKGFST